MDTTLAGHWFFSVPGSMVTGQMCMVLNCWCSDRRKASSPENWCGVTFTSLSLLFRDAERKRKVKQLFNSLATQEGEWKALKRKKFKK